MYGRVFGLLLTIAFAPVIPGLTVIRAQSSPTSISKTEALRNVRVSAVPAWSEVVSAQDNFRILFPGKPQIDDDVISIRGFKFANSAGKWSASCADLPQTVPNDEAALRELYQRSMDAMTRNKTYVMSSSDVSLNGRLGVEFTIRGSSRISYTRAFASGRRLYTISVSRKNPAPATDDPPADIQQFFDSFAYWD
jgi:hypothetical protein